MTNGINVVKAIIVSIKNVKQKHVQMMQTVEVLSYVIGDIVTPLPKPSLEDTVISGHLVQPTNNVLKITVQFTNAGIGICAHKEWSVIEHIAINSRLYVQLMLNAWVRISVIEENAVAIVLLITSHAGLTHD